MKKNRILLDVLKIVIDIVLIVLLIKNLKSDNKEVNE
nr:MAG TPA: hypothetical protein [Caudoviricetes sp.]